MAYGRRYRSGGRARSRRRLDWAHFSNVGGTGVELSDANRAAQSHVLADYQSDVVAAMDVDGVTITRIRGTVYWVPAATITQEYTGLALGFRTEESQDVGSLTDEQQIARANNPNLDWMYYRRHQTASAAAIAENGAYAAQGWPNHIELDIKSQRRLESINQSLYFWYGLTDTIGTGNSLRLFWDFRVLFKKP